MQQKHTLTCFILLLIIILQMLVMIIFCGWMQKVPAQLSRVKFPPAMFPRPTKPCNHLLFQAMLEVIQNLSSQKIIFDIFLYFNFRASSKLNRNDHDFIVDEHQSSSSRDPHNSLSFPLEILQQLMRHCCITYRILPWPSSVFCWFSCWLLCRDKWKKRFIRALNHTHFEGVTVSCHHDHQGVTVSCHLVKNVFLGLNLWSQSFSPSKSKKRVKTPLNLCIHWDCVNLSTLGSALPRQKTSPHFGEEKALGHHMFLKIYVILWPI